MSKQLLLLSLFVCLAVTAFAASDEQYRQIRFPYETRADLDSLFRLGLDVVYRGDDYIDVIVNEAEYTRLQDRGITGEIIHESVVDYYRDRLQAQKAMGDYKTLSEIYAYLDAIIADHPDIVSARQSIGQTIEGRDIWAVKISDNPNVDEDEPEVLYTAAIHAREVITPEALFYFMDHLTDLYDTDQDVQDIVNNRELWFILVCNPDGYYHNEVIAPYGGGMWRKNRRDNGDGTFGVDLNRNFGYRWGYDNYGSSPSSYSETYRGTGPFSEPETQNLRDFALQREFVLAVYLHSYSNLIIWPWGFRALYTQDEDAFAPMGDSMSSYNGYVAGPTATTIYSANGGSDDWYYGEQKTKNKIMAFTIEIGNEDDGFWPFPLRIPTLVQENLGPLMFTARAADRMFAPRLPQAPVVTADTIPPTGDYTISWSHPDTLNPAVDFDLWEFQGPMTAPDSANDLGAWHGEGWEVSAARYASPPTSFHAEASEIPVRSITTSHPLTVEAGDTLRFQTRYYLADDCEYAYVEASTDGLEFAPLEGNITTEDDPNGMNRGHGITGASAWTEATFDLSDYEGRRILIRFTYQGCPYSAQEGIYIDDIRPLPGFADTTVLAAGLADTSFDVTGRPDGFYWYQARARDAESQHSILSMGTRVEAGYVPPCCVGTTGDVNCSPGGVVDISDVQTLIDNLFLTLTPLCCEESANLNYPGSGSATTDTLVDITDLSLLIDNQFLTLTPLPPCP